MEEAHDTFVSYQKAVHNSVLLPTVDHSNFLDDKVGKGGTIIPVCGCEDMTLNPTKLHCCDAGSTSRASTVSLQQGGWGSFSKCPV
jgi:hypothetical protein